MGDMKLFRHRNGYYYIRYGRGVEKSLKTKDEKLARNIFDKKERQHNDEILHRIEKRKLKLLNDFIDEYLDIRKAKSRNTYRADKLALDKFREWYGNRSMAGITAKKMDQYRAFLKTAVNSKEKGQERNTLKINTVNNYIRHLKIALKTALKWGYMSDNVLDDFRQYNVDRSTPRFLEIADVKKLLTTAGEISREMQTAMAIQYFCGLGRAEIMSQLNIGPQSITYRRVKTGKLGTVPIPDGLRPYIAHLNQGIQRIITWKHPDTYSKHFSAIAKKAGLEGVSPHRLRHTCATHLMDAGVGLEVISQLLNHSDINITRKYYAHLREEKIRDAVNLLKLE
jgi:site-specific recombinase XerD